MCVWYCQTLLCVAEQRSTIATGVLPVWSAINGRNVFGQICNFASDVRSYLGALYLLSLPPPNNNNYYENNYNYNCNYNYNFNNYNSQTPEVVASFMFLDKCGQVLVSFGFLHPVWQGSLTSRPRTGTGPSLSWYRVAQEIIN